MKAADLAELCALAALWGGSFLFTRIAAPEFGAFALAGLRVIGAMLALLPVLALRGETRSLAAHWKPILWVGVTNSALPFVCFAYAALTIGAGLSSIFNAASPLFGAVIGWLWLNDRLSASRTLGLVIGFAGVFGLAWSHAGVKDGADALGTTLAIAACLVGTVSYGYSANFAKRHLAAAAPIAVATGSQIGAALVLVVPTVLLWPATPPGVATWIEVALLAVFCTGLAYVMYFRLIAHVGPANAITVTFLVPVFAVAWGALFLGETLAADTLAGCAVILLGTALATGVLQRQRWLRLQRG